MFFLAIRENITTQGKTCLAGIAQKRGGFFLIFGKKMIRSLEAVCQMGSRRGISAARGRGGDDCRL